MEYRQLGRTGLRVSAIGLGTEHLKHSRETMDRVLGMAVEAGINYIDLLYNDPKGANAGFWDGFGPSLRAHRDRLVLAAHWGGAQRYDIDYCQRSFDDLLEQLGNGYAEVAMLTMVDTETKWNGWAQESLARLERYREQGRIGAVALSGHRAPLAIKAVTSGLIDAIMYPLNLISHLNEGDKALLQACVEHNVGLIAMKAYAGGMLFLAKGQAGPISPAQCLAYVLSLPVSTVVPGPKNAKEMQATLHFLEAAAAEKDYSTALANIGQYVVGQCLYCNHCLPCPQDIDIGQMMHLADAAQFYVREEIVAEYAALPVKATDCSECGACMERCPYEVDVISKMRQVVSFFAGQ